MSTSSGCGLEHLFSGDSGIIFHDAKTVYTFGRCAISQLL